MKSFKTFLLMLVAFLMLAGAAQAQERKGWSRKAKGAAIGAGAGAATGAVVGGGKGALIGAAAGTVAGGPFLPVAPRPLVACVWELAVIAHERAALIAFAAEFPSFVSVSMHLELQFC